MSVESFEVKQLAANSLHPRSSEEARKRQVGNEECERCEIVELKMKSKQESGLKSVRDAV